MKAIATSNIALLAMIARWVAAAPLMQAITACIDDWADDIHGPNSDPLR
jgi:hypothetical protein